MLRIKEALASISQPRGLVARTMAGPPAAPMKIAAPSGFGKSALLIRAFQLARKKGAHVVYLGQLGNLSVIENQIVLTKSIEGIKFNWRLLLPTFTLAPGLDASWKEGAEDSLRKALKKKLRWKKVIFLLDDVQDHHLFSLKLLLGVVEEMMAEHYPVTMIMAGLPQLEQRLAKVNIRPTSWSNDLRIQPLSKEEAAESLLATFQRHGFKVTPEALALMAEHSCRHPHFVKKVGSVVWETARNEKRWEIDGSLMELARAQIQASKKIVYDNYCAKIKNKKLLPFAREIVRIVQDSGAYMTRNDLIESLNANFPDMNRQEIEDKMDVLQELEFFWENAEQELEPSIPSIFDYIKRLK